MATTNDKTTTTAVVAKKPEDAISTSPKIATFRTVLEKMKGQLSIALPKHVDVDRMLRIVFTTVQRTPSLLDCTQESLLGAIMQCAQLGLEPDGLLGHAYLVPFKNNKAKPARLECQLMVGYKGLLKLARQSGEIASVSARVVYSRDVFEYEYGLNEKLRHVPYMEQGKDDLDGAGYPVCAYAIFRLKDGSHHFDVMGFREIEYVRGKSQAATGPAWTDWWDEMAKKTVLRRASKMSPASVEDRMARAIALDELADAGLSQQLDGAVNSLALTAVPPEPPPAEGQRVPMKRPEIVTPITTAAAVPADASEEDPDAAARAAVAPTAAEIAAHEAEGKGADGEELPDWAKKS